MRNSHQPFPAQISDSCEDKVFEFSKLLGGSQVKHLDTEGDLPDREQDSLLIMRDEASELNDGHSIVQNNSRRFRKVGQEQNRK